MRILECFDSHEDDGELLYCLVDNTEVEEATKAKLIYSIHSQSLESGRP